MPSQIVVGLGRILNYSSTPIFLVLLALGNQSAYAGGNDNFFSSKETGKRGVGESGVILEVRPITIRASNQSSRSVGASIGGLLGNHLTKDQDSSLRNIATVTGSVTGAATEEVLNKNVFSATGVELLIEVLDGSVVSIVQESSTDEFRVGADVWVIVNSGKYRVVPKQEK